MDLHDEKKKTDPDFDPQDAPDEEELNSKEIMLTIRTVQESKDSEPETIDLISEGFLYKKKGATYLCYDESELSGIANNRVILKVKNNRSIQMNRFGEFSTELLFEKRKRQTSLYSTPYGEFRVEILTDRVDIDLKEDSGSIYIEYTVSISGTPEVKNKLSISYV